MKYFDIKPPPKTYAEYWKNWVNNWESKVYPHLSISKKIKIQVK
jgi:hypothetical protein